MKPLILFCNSPVAPHKPNEMFEDEFNAAKLAGFEIFLFNDDLLSIGDVKGSLKAIASFADPTPIIYRGWMLKETAYYALCEALKKRNLYLINNPDEYLNAHYLPRAYPFLQLVTPKTIWFPVNTSIDVIASSLNSEFGNARLC